MNNKLFFSILMLFLVVITLSSSVFIVSERQRAVQLRFREITKENIPAGLHFKIPFIDQVKMFEARLQTVRVPSERFLTLEQKAVIVDSYIKWRIHDVGIFYRATAGDSLRANALLVQRAESRMRNKFGGLTLTEVVSGQRDELMKDITESLGEVARTELGVDIIDVRVKRIDLPAQVSDSVFSRMSSEREKEAQEYRAKGREAAEIIRANADKEKRIILAESYKKAEIIRGDGDAKAAEIYANAYKKDPEFYAFTRRLKSYRESFKSANDILVLDPKGDFFEYFSNKNK